MKADLQAAVSKLESDRAVFERQKAAELQAIEEQKEEVARTMKREKNVLEKQRKVGAAGFSRFQQGQSERRLRSFLSRILT